MLLQLANTYSPTKNYGVTQWLSSPKLDGIRCLYENQTSGLRSRSGKTRFFGFTDLEQICETIRSANDLSFIDGELYIPGEPFDVISSIVRTTKASSASNKQRVEFRIFAIGFNQYPNIVAADEYNQIQQIFPAAGRINYVPHKLIDNDPIVIQAEADLVKSSGISNEGIMLRNPNSMYFQGRSIALLKVKNFVKIELPVTGFGVSSKTNTLRNLLVQGIVNGQLINSQVGTGFTDAERTTIFANRSDYLGRTIEIIHLGITARGYLRHPVFSKFV